MKNSKVSMKKFTVLYKKLTKREQLSPDMRSADHTLHISVITEKSLASAKEVLSKMENVKVVRITENGASKSPIFKIATTKQFFSQKYSS